MKIVETIIQGIICASGLNLNLNLSKLKDEIRDAFANLKNLWGDEELKEALACIREFLFSKKS